MERKSTNTVDDILVVQKPEPLVGENAEEASVTGVGKTEKALPDSARKTESESQRDGEKRFNATRTVMDRVMGNRAQLTSGSGELS